MPRSKFLAGATLGLGALIGGLITLPVAGFALLPAFLGQQKTRVDLGPISNFEPGQWYITTFVSDPAEGEVSRRTAFIRNNGTTPDPKTKQAGAELLDHLEPLRPPRLPGAGERPDGQVHRQEDRPREHAERPGDDGSGDPAGYGCPCHGGQYDTEGNRTAGPPVRALDRYDFAIVNGRLVLLGPYSVSHVDGTGARPRSTSTSWPARASTSTAPSRSSIPSSRRTTRWRLRRPPTKHELRSQQAAEVVMYPLDWLEERSGLVGGVKYFLFRNVPADINWMQTLGSAALTAFLVQAITGVILAMYYVPSAATTRRRGSRSRGSRSRTSRTT